MPHMKKPIELLFILFCFQIGFSQSVSDLTAEEIINSSLDQIGGLQKIKSIKTSELAYAFINSDEEVASIIEKINISNYFTQSILSKSNLAQTTFFNGKNIVKIEGDSISEYNLEKIKDELKLKTYNHIQYGYKELDFSLIRLPDEDFQNFECYVISAESKNGYSTINFFDKSSSKLVMIVFPSGNKSLLIEQIEKDGIQYNSHILNKSVKGDVSHLKLLDVKINKPIADVWFQSPYTNSSELPHNIMVGKFKPVNSNSILSRNESTQTETYGQNKKTTNDLKWKSNDVFELIIAKNPTDKQNISVRIVSWNENEYVCHYMTDKAVGTQEYTRTE
jgi:hypothetical protein